jgi:RimJ/RimL family protein N-acetyltransferase
MDAFPVIETDRIKLRKPGISDIPKIMEYANNPRIAEMTLNIPHPYEAKDAIAWLQMANEGFEDQSHFVFGICLLDGDEFIGGIGLNIEQKFNRAELGFWLAEPFWNQGYMTEAVIEVLAFGFDKLKLNKIYATHFWGNPASGKVMAKNGMIKEAELKEHIRKDDEYKSLIQYRVTRREFEEMR